MSCPVPGCWRGDVEQHGEGLDRGIARVEGNDGGIVAAQGHLPLLQVMQRGLSSELVRHAPCVTLGGREKGGVKREIRGVRLSCGWIDK